MKKENEKIKIDLKKANELKDELIIKYEKITKEKDKLKLIKEDIKQKLKEKDKEINYLNNQNTQNVSNINQQNYQNKES